MGRAPRISIHALLAESDRARSTYGTRTAYFYPRSPCGERRRNSQNIERRQNISIHALLAESDERTNSFPDAPPHISIHALLAESDSMSCWSNRPVTIFLSTLSLRRATGEAMPGIAHISYFYPRSPCGERLLAFCVAFSSGAISIHALLAESDGNKCCKGSNDSRFLSTLSLRRATQ